MCFSKAHLQKSHLNGLIELRLNLNPICETRPYIEVVIILSLKGIVHFEINFWYVLAYLKGIQDVGVFVSTVIQFSYF